MDLSIVIPCYNEVDSLPRLAEALDRFVGRFEGSGQRCEVLLVDDGSGDGSRELGAELAEGRPYLRQVALRRNFGQTAAMAAGFDLARGEVVVPMDADLQNDPEDIPLLLAKLDEGFDVVSGWRRRRKDFWLTRRLPSTVANWFISRVGGLRLHDYGCTLKAYRRELLQHVKLYGEMHRFIPLHAKWSGARVAELEVSHHPRKQGRSKYGLGRTFKVLLDLITVKFLGDYSTKPLYFFGSMGFFLCLAGVFCGGITLVEKYSQGVWVHRNPLLLLAVFLFIVGLLLVSMGLLGELLVRIYHEAQGKPIYLLAAEPPPEPKEAPSPSPSPSPSPEAASASEEPPRGSPEAP